MPFFDFILSKRSLVGTWKTDSSRLGPSKIKSRTYLKGRATRGGIARDEPTASQHTFVERRVQAKMSVMVGVTRGPIQQKRATIETHGEGLLLFFFFFLRGGGGKGVPKSNFSPPLLLVVMWE